MATASQSLGFEHDFADCSRLTGWEDIFGLNAEHCLQEGGAFDIASKCFHLFAVAQHRNRIGNLAHFAEAMRNVDNADALRL